MKIDTAYRATHSDAVTRDLRADGWQPTTLLPCGCDPSVLCRQHREIRAVEHYHPETIR